MARKRRGNGEGTIYKKDGKWLAQVTFHGRRLSKTCSTQLESQEWIREIHNMGLGQSFRSNQYELKDYLESWLDFKKENIKHKTYIQYSSIIRKFITPDLGAMSMMNLKTMDIQTFYQRLEKKKVGARTIQLVHSVLHAGLNKATKWGVISNNPASNVDRPKVIQKEMKVLSEKEIQRFLLQAKNHRLYPLFRLAVTSGMRLGELKGLLWRDVDWASSTISIKRQMQRQKGKGQIVISTKNFSSTRTISIGPLTLKVLMEHFEIKEREIGEPLVEDDLVFFGKRKMPLGSSGIQKQFKLLLKEAKLRPIRFHDLRHTAASLMLSAGMPVLQVSKHLGHSRASTTLDVYGHLVPGLEFQAAEKIDLILEPTATELQQTEVSPALPDFAQGQ